MADDIDIEEHDILSNPHIADMYLQYPSIKTEPVEYEDNYNEYSGVVYDENCQVKEEPLDCDTHQPTDLPIEFSEREPTPIRKADKFHGNRIILGRIPFSRPCPKSRKLRALFVSLEDWGERLNSSPCYCKECKTLFATRNAIDAHNMTAHSFLVPVESPPEREEEPTQPNYRFCNHCNTYFEEDNLLIQHLYDLIQAKQKSKDALPPQIKQSQCTSDDRVQAENTPGVFLRCQMCNCYFKSNNEFIKHCTRTHGMCQYTRVSLNGKFACKFCGTVLKTSGSHNKHIRDFHENEGTTKNVQIQKKVIVSKAKNMHNVSNRYKCVQCHLQFKNINLAKVHQRNVHGNCNKIVVSKNTVLPSSKLQRKMSAKGKTVLSSRGRVSLDTGSVPKNIIFKCDKCSKHFLNCITALSHAYQSDHSVKTSRGEWKCTECNRFFRHLDRHLHELQHKHTREFKVFVLHDNIYARVLSRCSACDVYFEERPFLKHTKRGCGPVSDVGYCSICKLNINNSAIHGQRHAQRKFIRSDFIIIDDFIQSNPQNVEKSITIPTPTKILKANIANTSTSILKRKLEESPGHVPKKKIGEPSALRNLQVQKAARKVPAVNNRMTFFYCGNCRAYLSNTAKRHYHVLKQCKAINKLRFICSICGLRFNSSQQKFTHREHHRQKNFHLKNFTFKCIKTLKLFTPPLPDFHKCKKCGVQFLTAHQTCDMSLVEECKLCKKSFNKVAFALHVQHHKYMMKPLSHASSNIENTLKMKYRMLKATWNILYNCNICDVTTDSYDDVIDHSQKHFNDMQSFDVTIKNCEQCSLNFEENCFNKHMELHSNQHIDRDSFTILKYDFSDLLLDSWLKIFDTLPKEQMTQILSRSIYVTRNVKMTLLQNGPPEYTIYKCQKCEKIVAKDDIFVHTESNTCKKYSEKHKCTFCTLVFATEKARDSHISIHKKQSVTMNSFRVVVFNHPDDLEFNARLRSECATKETSPGHNNVSLNANSYFTIKRYKFKYYRCERCYCCTSKFYHTSHHLCASETNMRLCLKCNNVFHSTGMRLHAKRHERSIMTPHDILIKPFNNDIKPGEWRVNLSRCHKCHTKFPTHLIANHTCIKKPVKKSTKTIPSMTLYRCPKCKILFSYKENLDKHMPRCMKFSKIERNTSTPEKSVFKCIRCDLYMLSRGAVRYHRDNDHKETHRTKCCQLCGWRFTVWSLTKHISLHHKTLQLTPNDICVIPFDSENDEPVIDKPAIESDKELIRNQIKSEKVDTEPPKIENRALSAGVKIDYVNRKPIKTYKSRKEKLEELRLKNEMITENEKSDNEIEIKTDKSVHENDESIIESQKSEINERVKYDKLKNTLFRCGKCDLHYLNFRTWISHVQLNHKVSRGDDTCSYCHLKFTTASLKRHIVSHRENEQLNVKILTLDEKLAGVLDLPKKVVSVFSNKDESTSNINESVVSQSSTDLEQSTLELDQTQEEQNVSQPDNTPSAPSETILQPDQTTTQPNQSQTTKKYTYKIYKCGHCNVHFMAQHTCYIHMLHHTPIDAKDYIECKLCDLPFKIMSLNTHIRKHHATNFNLDEVLVEEYTKDEGSKTPKIKIYYAIDSVQFRLVSTTSDEPSNTDDDKNNQPSSSNTEKNDDLVQTSRNDDNDVAMPVLPTVNAEVDDNNSNEDRNLNDAEAPNVIKRHKCQFCGEEFTSNTSKELHESLDHLDGEKSCDICNESFNASILNELHLCIKDNTFKCCQCGETLNVQDMTEHSLIHTS